MSTDREPPSLIDYIVLAISPVLIMLMVGSLTFFLVEVFYAGQYSGRLLYTLFFFVVGAVLIARIAIQYDAGRASLYGVGLGIVVYLALSYVDYPANSPMKSFGWFINLGLMGVIWWSANKLTWDCTYLDQNRDVSGRGLLSASGLEVATNESESDIPQSEGKKRKRKGTWLQRFEAYREKQRAKPHTPGIWVIYFSLAALPLFGLGQSLIAADDDARRRNSFLQILVYVASGLGLLVTTSLLGLRQYLRQRKVKLPAALTLSWLGLGAGLILFVLVLAAFLPRPHSEVPWFGIVRAGHNERAASKSARVGGAAGKGEGSRTSNPGDESKSGTKSGGSRQDDGGGSGGEKEGNSGSGDKNSGGEGKKSEGNQSGTKQDQTSRQSSPASPATGALEAIARFFKWLVFILVGLAVLIFIGLAVLRYLAPFTSWAQRLLEGLRKWWEGLFSRDGEAPAKAEPELSVTGSVRPPPFSSFSNPFDDGTANQRPPEELVAFTFSALDSWAWDHDSGRESTETPFEFSARVSLSFPEHQPSVSDLAALYARVAYSRQPLPEDVLERLEGVWGQLSAPLAGSSEI